MKAFVLSLALVSLVSMIVGCHSESSHRHPAPVDPSIPTAPPGPDNPTVPRTPGRSAPLK